MSYLLIGLFSGFSVGMVYAFYCFNLGYDEGLSKGRRLGYLRGLQDKQKKELI